MAHSFTITTVNGTEYQISRTRDQDTVIRWEDKHYDGPVGMQGGKVKVWEFCEIAGIAYNEARDCWQGNLSLLHKLVVTSATDRYTQRPIYGKGTWVTSRIVSIVRDDGKVIKADFRPHSSTL